MINLREPNAAHSSCIVDATRKQSHTLYNTVVQHYYEDLPISAFLRRRVAEPRVAIKVHGAAFCDVALRSAVVGELLEGLDSWAGYTKGEMSVSDSSHDGGSA